MHTGGELGTSDAAGTTLHAGTGLEAGTTLSSVTDNAVHSALGVGSELGGTATAATNPWSSVDVSHAFGNGVDVTADAATHSTIDSALSAGANTSLTGGLDTTVHGTAGLFGDTAAGTTAEAHPVADITGGLLH